jgi:hypothetical protein
MGTNGNGNGNGKDDARAAPDKPTFLSADEVSHHVLSTVQACVSMYQYQCIVSIYQYQYHSSDGFYMRLPIGTYLYLPLRIFYFLLCGGMI